MANTNNQNLDCQLQDAQAALRELNNRNLRVIYIHLKPGKSPVIQIIAGPGCHSLPAGSIKTYSTYGQKRFADRVSIVAGCQIRWTECAPISQKRKTA